MSARGEYRSKISSVPESGDSTKARILVAEDEHLSRALVASMLESAGYEVQTVSDGQEAVERAAHGQIDLVLLDVVMPRLSGLEACRIIKSMTADGFLPVVLVTVKTDTASRVEGLRIGADDYVCKPFDEQELLARVAGMLRIKRLHDQVVAQRARFERLSAQDEMTGLCNYRYLSTRLSEEFKRAERYHEPFACLLIDIDQLRAINDVAGRAAGDTAIKQVALAIRRCIRDVDVVARYGGDEFLLVLPNTHFAGSIVVAERLWREVGELVTNRALEFDPEEPARESQQADAEVRWAAGPRSLTVSIGVSLYPSRDVRTKDALLRAADDALSQAKHEGGNRICVFQQQGYIYTPNAQTREQRPTLPPPSSLRETLPAPESQSSLEALGELKSLRRKGP